MGQFQWKYTSNSLDVYEVSIYHGDDSKHVIIYVGAEIIVIDFSVVSDKSYSFYLGEEWFELTIKFDTNTINYTLENKDKYKKSSPDTFTNYPKKHVVQGIILVISIIFIILVILHFSNRTQ